MTPPRRGPAAAAVWGPERAGDVAELVNRALPEEALTEADLARCLWDETTPSLVVATPGGEGVAAAAIRDAEQGRFAAVQLIAVAPDAHRRGHGRALLDRLREWAFDEHGADGMLAGGTAPFYLWPGVDVRSTSALCLFERFGFIPTGVALNMTYPSDHRSPVPDGLVLRRAILPDDVNACRGFVARHWPGWVLEAQRALDRGTCLVVVDGSGTVVGFGCHSVSREGWLGPMGTAPGQRHGGLGKALLGAIAADLDARGLDSVEVSWLGPVGFYANAAGATMSRAFQTMMLPRPVRSAGAPQGSTRAGHDRPAGGR